MQDQILKVNLQFLKRNGRVLIAKPWEAAELVDAALEEGIEATTHPLQGLWAVEIPISEVRRIEKMAMASSGGD